MPTRRRKQPKKMGGKEKSGKETSYSEMGKGSMSGMGENRSRGM